MKFDCIFTNYISEYLDKYFKIYCMRAYIKFTIYNVFTMYKNTYTYTQITLLLYLNIVILIL